MKRLHNISVILSMTLLVCMLTTACGKNMLNNADNNAGSNIDGKTDNRAGSNTGGNVDNYADAAFAQTEAAFINVSEIFSNRDMSGEYDESKCDRITLSDTGSTSDSKGVVIAGNTVKITKEGDYILNGALSGGMIIVDVDKTEKVQLVLNGVNINSDTSAAIYVKSADKVFVTLADGTVNTLSNGGGFTAIDDNNIDAVIFSKDDLTLNGTGSLIITSPAGHGVVSKNELVITNGSYDIKASLHGLSGKDSVAIADGSFNIEAGKDALHSANDDDDTAGNVYIGGGVYAFSAESDGISAINEINIAGGSISINKSYEGIEGRSINISGGRVDITSSDDGLNATDKRGTVENEAGGNSRDFRGGMMNDTQNEANINISGGIINIDAEGDGIDSNGYVTISGGEIYVAGPSNGGNGALDYGIDAVISGGIIVAAGQSNMAQNFGHDSTQGAILVNTQKQNAAGSDIILLDSKGNTLVAWTMEKSYNSVVVSCPAIAAGESYTLITGETTTEITMDGLIYGDGFGFGGRGGFGAPGNRGEFDDSNVPDAPGGFGGRGDFDRNDDENDMRNHGFGNGERPERLEEPPEFGNGERPEGMEEPPEFDGGERPEGMEAPPDFKNGKKP